MYGNNADLERAVAALGMGSHLVQDVVYGKGEWTVLIDGVLVPVQATADLEGPGRVVVNFMLPNAPGDEVAYHLHVNGVYVQSEPGTITKGRTCRLRMVFLVQEAQRSLAG